MHFSKFRLIGTLILVVLTLAAFGCRTKTRQTTPETVPQISDTAPDVTPETPVEQPDFVPSEPSVSADDLPADIEELNRRAAERGWIRDAFFGYDEATLSPDAQDALSTSATWLRANPQYNLLIEGHCDERGTEQYNLALGDRRANAARDYLVTLGVAASRMRTVSYGEERPFATGARESAWSQNRRAHLVITGR
jgi:peptidoglycan-associated lipoprotein